MILFIQGLQFIPQGAMCKLSITGLIKFVKF